MIYVSLIDVQYINSMLDTGLFIFHREYFVIVFQTNLSQSVHGLVGRQIIPDSGLSLVERDHVTWTLASHWPNDLTVSIHSHQTRPDQARPSQNQHNEGGGKDGRQEGVGAKFD